MLSPGWRATKFDNRRRSHGYADESAFPIMLDHVRNEFPLPEHAKAACSTDCRHQLIKKNDTPSIINRLRQGENFLINQRRHV
ncbi:hypothetical protein WME89_06275 [Sorangium sp. So ce321]|uniref:hypothetical protein n=1 Tax=Sorangium sp. So ce321 TaxID=3133300 RepID=UPI003F60C04B